MDMRINISKILSATAVGLLTLGIVVLLLDPSSSGGSDGAFNHSDGGQMDAAGDELVIPVRTEGFQFMPPNITVKVGQTVRLILDNRDPVLHDYTVDQPDFLVLRADGAMHENDENEASAHDNGHETDTATHLSLVRLHIAAAGNEHAELIFEATEPGHYVLYCSVPGHRDAGMEGSIIVEE